MEYVKSVTLFELSEKRQVKYLGIDLTMSEDSKYIYLTQENYIRENLNDYGDYDGKEIKCAMDSNINLRAAEPNPENPSLLPMTGKFRYLCDRTRPDILVAVGEISTGGSEGPSDLHKKVAVQIYNYLKCTPKLGMKLGGGSKRIVHFAMSEG